MSVCPRQWHVSCLSVTFCIYVWMNSCMHVSQSVILWTFVRTYTHLYLSRMYVYYTQTDVCIYVCVYDVCMYRPSSFIGMPTSLINMYVGMSACVRAWGLYAPLSVCMSLVCLYLDVCSHTPSPPLYDPTNVRKNVKYVSFVRPYRCTYKRISVYVYM